MVGNSKILTVSYGTFSCTLEGFDDSFGTMKAIAEYFRDLAADDRYFGAEPPAPDADMLARIAEREIARRVEAHEEDGKVHLRAAMLDAPADQPVDQADQMADEAPAQPVADAPEIEVSEAADAAPHANNADTGDASDSAAKTAAAATVATGAVAAAVSAVAAMDDTEDTSAEADEIDAPAALLADDSHDDSDLGDQTSYYEDDTSLVDVSALEDAVQSDPVAPSVAPSASVDSVAAKLQRIRAVVSGDEDLPEPDYSEDEHAEDFLRDADRELEDLMGDGEEIEPVESERPIDEALDALLDDDIASEPMPENAADKGGEDALAAGSVAEAVAVSMDAPEAEAEVAPMAAADAEVEAQSDAVAPLRLHPSQLAHDLQDDLEDGANDPEVFPSAEPVRARVIRMKHTEFDRIVAEGLIEEDVDDEDEASAQPAPAAASVPQAAGSLSAEDEAELQRELAEVEAELAGIEEVEAPVAEHAAEVAADVEAAETAVDPDPETVAAVAEDDDAHDDMFDDDRLDALSHHRRPIAQDFEDEDLEDDAALSADLRTEDEDAAEAHSMRPIDEDQLHQNLADARREEPEAADEDEARDEGLAASIRDLARKTVKLGGEGRTMLTSKPVEDGSSMDRLLDETNSQLDEPRSRTRRNAIQHLRAAVAATKAEKEATGHEPAADSTEAYRDDLAEVVRPRRPVSSDSRSARPSAQQRPAPLQLVAEQRVDVATSDAPVRPRRVDRTAQSVDVASEDSGDFAAFAEEMGANSLADKLEAAAAYMSFVEGRDAFSRPQLLTRVRSAGEDEFSREDGLRSFGQLLRQGKIEKLRGGRFTASEQIGFRPDARAAG